MPDGQTFVIEWQAAWNSHDLDRIMQHYRDDVTFRSRKAVPLIGSGEVCGKAALRAYWAEALKRQPNLAFRVEHVLEGHDMLVILYRNQSNVLAAETLYFDRDGFVFQAAACHDVIASAA